MFSCGAMSRGKSSTSRPSIVADVSVQDVFDPAATAGAAAPALVGAGRERVASRGDARHGESAELIDLSDRRRSRAGVLLRTWRQRQAHATHVGRRWRADTPELHASRDRHSRLQEQLQIR